MKISEAVEACEFHSNEYHHALADFLKSGDLKDLEKAAHHWKELQNARRFC